MIRKVTAEVRQGDFTDDELRAIIGALIGRDMTDVCEVATVASIHTGTGGHELVALSTIVGNRAELGGFLRHGADHVAGGCKRCRKIARKGDNHASA